jgi:glutaminyl-peptide cyclotransferase
LYSDLRFRSGLLLVVLMIGAAVPGPASCDEKPVFDGERAMALLVRQCDMGPRLPGSAAHESLRRFVAAHADSLGLPFTKLCFDQEMPGEAGVVSLCNLVITCGEGDGPPLWLGAHYDTRPHCDLDPDPVLAAQPLPGANDGASGVAVLLHLAEIFAASPPPRPVALLFFDGEDSGTSGDVRSYCLGSQRLAARWNDFGSPLAGSRPEALIVIDMVGKRGLDLPFEMSSYQTAGGWLESLYARAAELDLQAFRPEPGRYVFDDHVPFIEQGIRAINLIDFDFPEWHTAGDVPAVCAPASLEQVGRLLADVAYSPLD